MERQEKAKFEDRYQEKHEDISDYYDSGYIDVDELTGRNIQEDSESEKEQPK